MGFIRLEPSVYLDKHPHLRYLNGIFFVSGIVLLIACVVLLVLSASEVVEKSMSMLEFFCFLFSFTFLITAYAIRVHIREKDFYPRPSWNLRLGDSENCSSIPFLTTLIIPEGDDAWHYAHRVMCTLISFAIMHKPLIDVEPGTGTTCYDLINSTNYCACDLVMFAAQLGQQKIAANGGKDAEQVSKRYLFYMESAVFCIAFPSLETRFSLKPTSLDVKKLENYLSTRHFLQNTREKTIFEIARILCYDCGIHVDPESPGWEIPEGKEFPSWVSGPVTTWDSKSCQLVKREKIEYFKDTVGKLYAELEKLFDSMLIETAK